jgi:deazaflavin-dependent oxidoreductase (nitroreductase family)
MKILVAVIAGVSTIGGALLWWRRHPRAGAGWVNRVANPWLLRTGVPAHTRGEIGLLEHVGRKSGAVRVTPVHPAPTASGFRIIVPLGGESQWARNVVAAGHCRLQVGDEVFELDEPRLISPMLVEGLPAVVAHLTEWLGFRYLALHQFARRAGSLSDALVQQTSEVVSADQEVPEPIPA